MKYMPGKSGNHYRENEYRVEGAELLNLNIHSMVIYVAFSMIFVGVGSLIAGSLFHKNNLLIISLVGLALVYIVVGLIKAFSLDKHCKTLGVVKVVGYDDHPRYGFSDIVTTPVYELEHNGKSYMITLDEEYSDAQDIPAIGSTRHAYYNENNPYQAMTNKISSKWNKQVRAGVVIFLITLVVGVGQYFVSENEFFSSKYRDGIVTDSYIQKRIIKDRNADFIVYEREIIAKDGNYYYFDEIGGVSSVGHGDSIMSIGDKVFWIKSDKGDFIIDGTDYEYEGTHYYLDRPEYMTDGKFILTDEYIADAYGDSDFKVYDVSFRSRVDNKWEFIERSGRKSELFMSEESPYLYWNVSYGDDFYWISTSKGAFIVSKNKNVYTGTKLQ